jgi:hypothetical protein
VRVRFPSRLLIAVLLGSAPLPGGCAAEDASLEIPKAAKPCFAPAGESCLERWADAGDPPVPEPAARASDPGTSAPAEPAPGSDPPAPAAEAAPGVTASSEADPATRSGFPLGASIACLCLALGCVAAAWTRMRRCTREVEELRLEVDLRMRDHEEAYLQLAGRVEDMAARLARSTAERRELSASRRQVAPAQPAPAEELQPAEAEPRTFEDEPPGPLPRREEPGSYEAGDLQLEVAEAFIALAGDLAEEQPLAVPYRRAEAVAREEGIAMHERIESEPTPSVTQSKSFLFDPDPEAADLAAGEHGAWSPDPGSAASARFQELERRLSSSDEQVRGCLAATESLRGMAAAHGGQIDAVAQRCTDLERQVQQIAAREPAPQGVPAERVLELEERIESHDEELRRRVATIDSLRTELDSSRQRIEAAERRGAQLEQLSRHAAQDEQARQRRETEQQQAWTARTSDLERQVQGRDADLRQRAGTIDLLQRELVEKGRQTEAAEKRASELEHRLQTTAQEEQARLRREQESQQTWTARVGEIEAQLERRDEELRRRTAEIDRLGGELVAKDRRIEAAEQRCAELEVELRREQSEGRERVRSEQELQRSSSARAGELEGRVASLQEELRRLAATAERCTELEQQLQRQTEESVGRESQARGIETSRLSRIAELEAQVADRNEELRRIRDAHTRLAEQARYLSEQLDGRVREVQGAEERIGDLQARAEALDAAARRNREDSQAGEALVDELVENRLTELFRQRGVRSPEPLPEIYLDALKQGDLDLAMQGLLGEPEPLAPASMGRLGDRWRSEHAAWSGSPIDREVLYLWADALRLPAGLDRPEAAVLAVVGSHADGSRSVLAVESGDPKSKEAWLEILRSLVLRGMNVPRLVVAPGSSGIWAGIDEVGWDSARQYCWSHEAADVLARLPKKRHARAGAILRDASVADTRASAKKLRDRFVKRCGRRFAGAGEHLSEDWKFLTSFYGFPEDHWPHLRTTSVIEAPIAAIELSAVESKAARPSLNAAAVLWKLLTAATRAQKKLSAKDAPHPPAAANLRPKPAARAKAKAAGKPGSRRKPEARSPAKSRRKPEKRRKAKPGPAKAARSRRRRRAA